MTAKYILEKKQILFFLIARSLSAASPILFALYFLRYEYSNLSALNLALIIIFASIFNGTQYFFYQIHSLRDGKIEILIPCLFSVLLCAILPAQSLYQFLIFCIFSFEIIISPFCLEYFRKHLLYFRFFLFCPAISYLLMSLSLINPNLSLLQIAHFGVILLISFKSFSIFRPSFKRFKEYFYRLMTIGLGPSMLYYFDFAYFSTTVSEGLDDYFFNSRIITSGLFLVGLVSHIRFIDGLQGNMKKRTKISSWLLIHFFVIFYLAILVWIPKGYELAVVVFGCFVIFNVTTSPRGIPSLNNAKGEIFLIGGTIIQLGYVVSVTLAKPAFEYILVLAGGFGILQIIYELACDRRTMKTGAE